MNWQTLWDYFGNFNDREGLRVFTILAFVFGVPVAIGLLAKTIAWSVKQVALCSDVLRGHDPEPPNCSMASEVNRRTVSVEDFSLPSGVTTGTY